MDNNFNLTDNELIELFKSDNNTVALGKLIEYYKPFILSRISYYGFAVSDREDLLQECLIGLCTAVSNYKADKASFFTFLKVCIDRMLITQLRRRSNQPNEITLSSDAFQSDINFADDSENPQHILEQLEDFEQLNRKIKSILSDLEYAVFLRLLKGEKYSEISLSLNKSVKSVDNAVQRIRTKLSNI